MYLKQLDIIGFKSFADRTRLTFEPGMIAIVGPNGCGKSVSDSIRWVLGEQRPTAIRCSKLVDVVFNGTDTRKPLGLAEVSITFADCEKELGTEYHEVTVTRRVYRSGEGEYFINKVKCGLKDIKRLFMGTGIGTSSYSVMAQGQIDAILSSKPEDRRGVFEEAAGITKFKADRKEALRKIDQTNQNLLREADVLREMKRQIGSLQRQVGKAKRYKELRDELRGLDIYVSKGKIQAFNLALEMNAKNQRETEQAITDAAAAVNAAESEAQQIHADMHAIEERLAALQAQAASAEGAYTRAREVIGVNEQRIAEYKAWSDRDGREIHQTRQQLEEIGMQTESLAQKTALLEDGFEAAKAALEAAEKAFRESSAQIDELRRSLQEARSESVACDRHATEVRDEIARLETQARETLMKRERLASEVEQLEASSATAAQTLAEVQSRLDAARTAEEGAAAASEAAEERKAALASELETLRANFGQMQAEAAAKEAQLDLLNDTKAAGDAFAAGAQALLDGALGLPEGTVLGSLADRFDAPPEYRIALEAALRAWLDAVVVKDAAAAQTAVAALLDKKAGSARLISLEAPNIVNGSTDLNAPKDLNYLKDFKDSKDLRRLLDCVTVTDDFKDAAEVLLGDVLVAAGPVPGFTAVTTQGVVYRADGTVDVWMPGTAAASPLSRKMLISETTASLDALKAKIEAGRQTLATGAEQSAALAEQARNAAMALANARRAAAQAEGEHAGVKRDAEALSARLARARADLDALKAANAGDDARRSALADDLEATLAKRDALMDRTAQQQDDLQARETAHGEESRRLTEKRITAAQMESELQLTAQQSVDAAKRRDELQKMIEGREAGIRGYEDSIQRLRDETAELMGSLDDLKEQAVEIHGQVEEARIERGQLQQKLSVSEGGVGAKRAELDKAREFKGKLEIAATEATMRRQNVYDHLNTEYGLDPTAVLREPDPEWKGGEPPPNEELEAKVNALTAQIAALGPVNMVAIEEYQELEERYTREKAQEADLLAAKEQILALITNLNEKSGEMFRMTFGAAGERRGSAPVRHRHHRPPARKASAKRHAPLRRRAHDDGRGAAFRDLHDQACAVLHARRAGRRPRRREHRPLRRRAEGVPRPFAVPDHHAQPAHDRRLRSRVRREPAGEGREPHHFDAPYGYRHQARPRREVTAGRGAFQAEAGLEESWTR